MRALVVYESMFGNTRTVAQAIAEGIRMTMQVEAVEVASAPSMLPPDVALLVVGAPTHVHGMSTLKSRATAAVRAGGPVISKGWGMREWLASLRPGPVAIGAAFDTRTSGPTLLTGSAANVATKRLRQAGLRHVEEPHSFVLDRATDGLTDRVPVQELDQARAWGARLASEAVGPV